MTAPVTSLSLDLDNLWSYKKVHGDSDWDAYDTYLPMLVPRVLEFLAARDLTITFFVVGIDATFDRNQDAIRSIAEAGHEIANHSFRHEPWLHLYSHAETHEELANAEEALAALTGTTTVGFRGPGYSVSETTLDVLAERGYRYDASTLPTWIGPLARAYYFRSTDLSADQRKERSALFGTWKDVRRPVHPYSWAQEQGTITELPVTTMPLARVPIHFSYLLYLAGVSQKLALAYLASAIRICKLRGVAPSLLMHPLDFIGGDDLDELDFFPAMNMTSSDKMGALGEYLERLGRHWELRTMIEHVEALEQQGLRPMVPVATEAGVRPRPARAS